MIITFLWIFFRCDQMAIHIEPYEIEYHIATSSCDTGGGLDNMSYDLIKILNSDILKTILTKFYKQS